MTAARRYGVLSDIHGNLAALLVAIDTLAAAGAERFLCLGDVVGYGPQPDECARLVASLDPVAVAGNHEYILLDLLSDARCTPSAQASLAWTRSVLTDETRAGLARLPLVAELPGAVLAHGSPDRIDEYVRGEDRARELLERMGEERPRAKVLLLGHTHEAWVFSRQRGSLLRARSGVIRLSPEERVLINPGSVGQSRDRRAHSRFALLDLEVGVVELYSRPYDVAATRRALIERGLPADSCHVVPARGERARRTIGHIRRRVWW